MKTVAIFLTSAAASYGQRLLVAVRFYNQILAEATARLCSIIKVKVIFNCFLLIGRNVRYSHATRFELLPTFHFKTKPKFWLCTVEASFNLNGSICEIWWRKLESLFHMTTADHWSSQLDHTWHSDIWTVVIGKIALKAINIMSKFSQPQITYQLNNTISSWTNEM